MPPLCRRSSHAAYTQLQERLEERCDRLTTVEHQLSRAHEEVTAQADVYETRAAAAEEREAELQREGEELKERARRMAEDVRVLQESTEQKEADMSGLSGELVAEVKRLHKRLAEVKQEGDAQARELEGANRKLELGQGKTSDRDEANLARIQALESEKDELETVNGQLLDELEIITSSPAFKALFADEDGDGRISAEEMQHGMAKLQAGFPPTAPGGFAPGNFAPPPGSFQAQPLH